MQAEYSMDVEFRIPAEKHVVLDSWKGLSDAEFRKALRESVDTPVGEDGESSPPNMERLTSALARFGADEEFIKNEFDRLSKAYEFYAKVVAAVQSGKGKHVFQYDESTTVTVVAEEAGNGQA